MKNKSILILIAALLVGCTGSNVGCVIQGGADALLAPAIAIGLQCSNQSAILASLQQAGQKAGLCSAPAPAASAAPVAALSLGAQGIVSSICASLGTALVGSLAGSAIPSAWGCNPASATGALNGVITAACGLIPVIQSQGPVPAPVPSPAVQVGGK